MKKIIVFLFAIGIGNPLFAQLTDNTLKTKLDSVVDRAVKIYQQNGKRVGLSIGFSIKGKTYLYNYGETFPNSKILPTSRSIYEIGSITKTFTGLLVSHAISEGKLNLNDDVRKFLPEQFPNLQYPNSNPVKIAYLLAHTAKFPNSFGDVLSTSLTEQEFLSQLHAIRLDSLKKFKYEYSNIGYQLLGYVLGRIYHSSYQDLVHKYITGPLKMSDTRVSYADNEPLLKGFNNTTTAVDAMPVTFPSAGGLRSTVADLLKYLQYQNDAPNESVRRTQRIIYGDVDQEAFGFQWSIGKTWNWDQYLRIDGGTNGFRSFCVVYPNEKINIVILSNQKDDSAGLELYKLTIAIFQHLKHVN
jgi:D-alanyl-D-alanine-carboxypeptidase/D-alanyl-D-alanine-endopeptidase